MWIYLSLLWRKTSLVDLVLKLPKLPITRNPFSVTQTTGTDWNSRKINHCVWSVGHAWSRERVGGGRSLWRKNKIMKRHCSFLNFQTFRDLLVRYAGLQCIDKGSDKVALARSFPECRPRYFNLRDPYIKRKQFNITCLWQNVVAFVLKEWKCYNPEKLTNLMICGLLLITTWRNRALIYLPNKQKGVNTEQGECMSNFFLKIWLSYFILSSNGNPWVTLLARKKLIKPPKCTLVLFYFHRLFWPSSFWAGFSKY